MQMTFSAMEYESQKRVTRKAKFLAKMEKIVPWDLLLGTIRPFYHPNRTTGRRPIELALLLRMYLLQLWYGLSDEGCEDECHSNMDFRHFLGAFLGNGTIPDSTTLEHFRHLLEENNLAEKIFANVNNLLEENGLIMHGGTIVDATIMPAPSSTKNEKKQRDPEMKSTKKGNNYSFGAKLHTGTDAGSGAVVNATVTAANVADITEATANYREDDDVRYGDAAYIGVEKRYETEVSDMVNEDKRTKKEIEYKTSKRPSQRKEKTDYVQNWEKEIEKRKSRVRGKVEYPYWVLKRLFGIKSCIYKGLKKNANRFIMGLSCVNIWLFRERLA